MPSTNDTGNNLSPKERELFKALKTPPDWFRSYTTMQLYTQSSFRAFAQDLKGPAVESLRRCMNHLDSGKYRFTPEFEALIQL